MKKVLFSIIIIAALISCNNGGESLPAHDTETCGPWKDENKDGYCDKCGNGCSCLTGEILVENTHKGHVKECDKYEPAAKNAMLIRKK